jgi:hypothetical protein
METYSHNPEGQKLKIKFISSSSFHPEALGNSLSPAISNWWLQMILACGCDTRTSVSTFLSSSSSVSLSGGHVLSDLGSSRSPSDESFHLKDPSLYLHGHSPNKVTFPGQRKYVDITYGGHCLSH